MAQEFQGLYVKFGANTVEFDNSIKGINKAMTTLKKDYQSLNKQSKLDPGNIDTATKKLENLQEQARVGALKVQELKNEQAALGKEQVGTAEWQKLQTQIGQTEAQMQIVNRAIASTNKTISGLQPGGLLTIQQEASDVASELDIVNRKLKLDPTNTDLLANKQQLLAKQVELAGSKVEALRKEQSQLGNQDVNSAEWKEYARNISLAEVEADELKASVKDVGNATTDSGNKSDGLKEKFSWGAVAGGAAKIAQKGMDAVSGSLDAAISRVDTMDAFPKVLQNFGFSATDAKGATEKMAKSIEGLPTTMDQAVSAVQGYVGATGNLDQSVDLFQATNDAAMVFAQGSSEAVDQFSRAYQQSLSAGKVEAENFNSMNESMPGLMNKVAESMGMSMADLKSGLSDGSVSIEDFNKSFTNLDQQGGAGMQSLAKSAQDSSGGIKTTMQNVKTEIVKTIAGIIEAVGSDNIKNAFKAIQDAIKGVVDFVKKNSDWLKPLAAGIAIIVAGFKLWTTAIKVWQAAVKIATAVQTAFNIVMDANPISLIIIAIAALVAGLVYFFTQTKTGQQIVKAVWDAIKNAIQSVVDWFTNTALPAIQSFIDGVKNVFQSIGDFISNVWHGILNVIQTVINGIVQFVSDGWNGLVSTITSVVTTISNVISSVWNGIVNFIKGAVDSISSTISNVFGAIGNFISGVWNGIANGVSSAWNGIVNSVKNAVSGVWNAITSTFGKIGGYISGVWDDIIGTVSTWGGKIIDSIVNGLSGLGSAISNAVSNAIKSVGGVVGKVIDKILGKSAGSLNLGMDGVNGSGAINAHGLFAVKSMGVPEVTNNMGARTSLNINVTANNANGQDIARDIERAMVRRVFRR
ncbi:tape measure protein [Weissella diestrammenae]|uniref:Tape measure protein n=1 Tax=Weissella diestrammenae TaxID=1162633 RepID=A0A7G9T4R0_9LACO|nr:tape measure protein [Weissella diestrammenae]MCM0582796.1 tape measure protein [Weissella diestrammenae]QNN75085.1 tape measure protein [Weissella diestrammenae]